YRFPGDRGVREREPLGSSCPLPLRSSWTGIAVRRTASLPPTRSRASADSNPFRSSRSERRRVARLCPTIHVLPRRADAAKNFFGKIQAIYNGKCAPLQGKALRWLRKAASAKTRENNGNNKRKSNRNSRTSAGVHASAASKGRSLDAGYALK